MHLRNGQSGSASAELEEAIDLVTLGEGANGEYQWSRAASARSIRSDR